MACNADNLGKLSAPPANFRKAYLQQANLQGAPLMGIKNLTLDQLSQVKALYVAELDPELEEQIKIDQYSRRVGQEFTGLADMLAMLNLEYGSDEACEFIDGLLYSKAVEEIKTSLEIFEEVTSKARLTECFDILVKKYKIDIADCIDFKQLIDETKWRKTKWKKKIVRKEINQERVYQSLLD